MAANVLVVDGGVAPAGAQSATPPIVIAGNFVGDDRDELLIYRPGTGSEHLLTNFDKSGGVVTYQVNAMPQVSRTYTPIVGDFDGDGYDEIFWYRPGTEADRLWNIAGDLTVTSHVFNVNGHYRPAAGDFNGDGVDDILWYAPGTASDFLSEFDANPPGTFSYSTTELTPINSHYLPVGGDFTQDGADDVVWYDVSTGNVKIWDFAPGPLTIPSSTQLGTLDDTSYKPIRLDAAGDGYADIFWYRQGSAAEAFWNFTSSGIVKSVGPQVSWVYNTAAGDFFGDGHDDIFWMGTNNTSLWDWNDDGTGLTRTVWGLGTGSAASTGLLAAISGHPTTGVMFLEETGPETNIAVPAG